MEKTVNINFENTEIAFSAKSNRELRKAKWLFSTLGSPWMVNVGTRLTKLGLQLRLPIKGIIKNTIYEQFCGGETIQESEATIKELADFGIGTILDYSVEGAENEASFEQTANEIIKTIKHAKGNPHIPFCVFKMTGVARFALLEKVQAAGKLTDAEQSEWQRVKERVNKICSEAYALAIPIFIDAEETWIQEPIDQLTYQMMALYNKKECIVYNTYQMYRKDMLANLKKAYEVARQESYYLGAKLVRGAYMEKERERAEELNYPSPIQETKEATDRDYDAAVQFCLEHIDHMALCSGSHNDRSNALLVELMEQHGLPKDDKRVYSAQLYGMSDHISFNLAKAGYNVAKYVPYGPVESVMPYLFRRAEENTSIAGQTGRELSLIQKEIMRRKSIKS